MSGNRLGLTAIRKIERRLARHQELMRWHMAKGIDRAQASTIAFQQVLEEGRKQREGDHGQ